MAYKRAGRGSGMNAGRRSTGTLGGVLSIAGIRTLGGQVDEAGVVPFARELVSAEAADGVFAPAGVAFGLGERRPLTQCTNGPFEGCFECLVVDLVEADLVAHVRPPVVSGSS